MGYDIIYRAYHLYIRVEVNTTVFIQYPEAGIVANESIFLLCIRLCRIRNDIDIEVVFILFLYLIVRQKLLPRSDARLRQFRQRVTAKPTVMYYLRYHTFTI